jgi:hypothetical protein
MRVDPMMQLNEAITSVFEAIAYPSVVVLAAVLVVVAAVELRSRVRRADVKPKTGDRPAARDRREHRDRVAPATR